MAMSFFRDTPSISVLLFLFILLIASSFDIISCAPFLNTYSCSHYKYPDGSLLRSNLEKILADLPANASKDGFVSTSVGDSDQIFGLAICLAGFAPSSCQNCLQIVVENLRSVSNCTNCTSAEFWYDHCMVRYNSTSFFGIPDFHFSNNRVWGNNEANGGGLETTVYNLINKISDSAANNETRFALGQDNYFLNSTGNISTIYGLAQCTRDLSVDSCSTCLANYSVVLKNRGAGSTYTGGRIVGPSCFIWYDDKPFDNGIAGSSPSPGDGGSSPPPRDGSLLSPKDGVTQFNLFCRGASLIIQNTLNYQYTNLNYQHFKLIGSSPSPRDGGSHSNSIIIAVASACILLFLLGLALWFWRRKRRQMNIANSTYPRENVESSQELISRNDLQVFNLSTLEVATNNFSEENKLGEGGFGVVYKGTLEGGTEIAVKKLKKDSRQGILEFEAEVRSLAALKHRNLVRLIGYYMDDNVQLLCYEYLPNGSLDKILFGKCNGNHQLLSWEKRLKMAQEICCGLRYMHEEATNVIVHRDLKPANILLDKHMNPKLSDFGTAKFFEDETHKFTTHPICSFGYVAPEYYQHGEYSVKSDVYSFGVILLEIITGQKNCPPDPNSPSLIKNVIKKWIDGTIHQLKDPEMGSASIEEIKRCIQIVLCCVHENAANRPKTSDIYLMLQGHLDVPPVSEEGLKSWI